AGDTPVFGHEELKSTKLIREKEAIKALRKKWPKFTLLHALIAEYEDRKTPESIFVYALDKLLPVINNYLDNGRNWQKQGVDLATVIKVKTGKINLDEHINNYYQQLLTLIREKPELFTKD
ncbi:MAG: HD domain-containing protein, partial [Candidatus Saccharimonadales bacterium]